MYSRQLQFVDSVQRSWFAAVVQRRSSWNTGFVQQQSSFFAAVFQSAANILSICRVILAMNPHPLNSWTQISLAPPPVLAHAFLPFFHSLYCSESGMACVFHHRNRHNTPAQPSLGSTNRPNKINHSVGVCKSLFSSLHSTSNRMRRVRARLRTFLTSFWCWSQTQFDIKQKQSHTSAPNISADGDFIFVFNMTCSDCPRPIHITCWDRTLLCLWRNLMIRRVKTRCYEINLFF